MIVLKTSLRNFFAHKGRMALSAIAVLLSVAFVCGTLVFTDTVNATFDRLFNTTASDLTVKPNSDDAGNQQRSAGARPATLPASVVQKVAAQPGVKTAFGTVESTSVTVVDPENDTNIGPTSGAPTIATNWEVTPNAALKLTSGQAPHGPGQAMLDADTANKARLGIGDDIKVVTALGTFTQKITGIATFQTTNPGAAMVFMDTPTAQRELLGSTGEFTSVQAYGDGTRSDDQLKAEAASALGHGYTLQTKAEAAADDKSSVGSFLNVMKYAMLGFAGIAVLVGVFLIANTFSMLVAQRTREIGLMRAIGASRKQVNRSVLTEAVLLGVVGSALGIGGGIGIAVGLMQLMNSMGMHLDTSELTIKWTTPVAGATVGVIVTLVSAYLPSRRAAKVSPMAALRESGGGGQATARSTVVRSAIGLIITGTGAAALVAAGAAKAAGTGSAFLGFGVLLTLIGFIVIGPLLAAGVVRVLGTVTLRPFGSIGRMAQRNALRNPRRTGATAAALMIGLALVAGLSVVGSSMVASASDQINKSVGADFIIQTTTGAFTPDIVKAVKSTPGLGHVTEYKELPVTLALPDGGKSKQVLSGTDASYVQDLRQPVVAGTVLDAYTRGGITVGESFADSHRLEVGDALGVTFLGGRTAQLKIYAITSKSTAFDNGAMYVGLDTAARYIPAQLMPQDVMLFATSADSKNTQTAYTALKVAVHDYPQVQVRDQADYKTLLQNQIGQMLNLVYGLLALAIIVAVLGVVNTLALSVVERTREIGLMRAIGLSRRQLRRMIRLESVVIALFGAVIGLGLGMGWGTAAQKLLALQGLGTLAIPWSTITAVFIGAAVVGLLAALAPAFRASRMNVLNAIATE
ncbi:ABC transporter permease [Streptomyces sp. RB6PN25]|uniref:ABC transporter permease n=1 Tax=Streptomyces humicola TaxID=2953240 RepID=A0ABT1PS67_9ACTN|nr:ABC transporter permease [Streptomyces humicola]MCQ4080521.1 ABC transporter permease [Streptomyces humicola]